jgi:hypothetical protein
MNEKTANVGDDRLKKSSAEAVRGDRASSDDTRTQEDGTALTAAERRAQLRQMWEPEVLPTPPPRNGWHFCWLSTTNSTDPIYKRLQKGYSLVKYSELPEWSQYKVMEGEFADCIAVNEMILSKIPEDLYQDIMLYLHHELPLGEEELLQANARKAVEGADSNGRPLGELEGFAPKRVPTPHF